MAVEFGVGFEQQGAPDEEWKKDIRKEAAKDMAAQLNAGTKKDVPIDTGLLRRTLRARPKGVFVEVWGQFYGKIHQEGGRHKGWVNRWIARVARRSQ